jgi:hypothetical protein
MESSTYMPLFVHSLCMLKTFLSATSGFLDGAQRQLQEAGREQDVKAWLNFVAIH